MGDENVSSHELVPDWLDGGRHLPSLGVRLVEGDSLVVANAALKMFPVECKTYESFMEVNIQGLQGWQMVGGSDLLRRDGERLLKKDVSRLSVATMLTLMKLGQVIKPEGEGYVFEPVGQFWAFDHPNKVSVMMMEYLPDIRTIGGEVPGRIKEDIVTQAREAGIDINPMVNQDLLFRGKNGDGKFRVSLVDVTDEGILDRL